MKQSAVRPPEHTHRITVWMNHDDWVISMRHISCDACVMCIMQTVTILEERVSWAYMRGIKGYFCKP